MKCGRCGRDLPAVEGVTGMVFTVTVRARSCAHCGWLYLRAEKQRGRRAAPQAPSGTR
ncbi:MAG TPA: hypothetical protein VKN99_20385 [Polyangia bacterium]|nr:hypothetical protein [Polyangia bacterium]